MSLDYVAPGAEIYAQIHQKLLKMYCGLPKPPIGGQNWTTKHLKTLLVAYCLLRLLAVPLPWESRWMPSWPFVLRPQVSTWEPYCTSTWSAPAATPCTSATRSVLDWKINLLEGKYQHTT